MRQKAEKQIRAAAALLGPAESYRIDAVRTRTELVRKVFDKTLLDMARLKTVELTGGDTSRLSPTEIENLINHQGVQYVYFRFLAESAAPEPALSEPQIPALSGIEREQWLKFKYLCEKREGKSPVEKLCEMIDAYLKNSG